MVTTISPDDIREARRKLGQQLAALRKAAGHTQHSLAPLTLYGRSTVANAETGHQRPDRTFWQRCDDILHTGGILTAGYERIIAMERERQRARGTASLPPLPDVSSLAQSGMARPDLPGAVSGDTVVVTVEEQGRTRAVRVSRRELLQAVSGGVIAPLAVSAARVDPAIVNHFTALRAVLVESDNRVGAAAILPTALQQLGHIADNRPPGLCAEERVA